ncbi:hypothetical protein [Mycobacterium sp. 94-17]|uniref:hypothetical protein n=1 Tax=Mycobacterium sp. 94-17 TaxID=2986147 RepID=UPI002D1F91CF|nr:hypothetical protein [Mycobacterium sp. 94-17]MEB4210435.1 hypothetical protein [Mycobacterium sp. 94-17]
MSDGIEVAAGFRGDDCAQIVVDALVDEVAPPDEQTDEVVGLQLIRGTRGGRGERTGGPLDGRRGAGQVVTRAGGLRADRGGLGAPHGPDRDGSRSASGARTRAAFGRQTGYVHRIPFARRLVRLA